MKGWVRVRFARLAYLLEGTPARLRWHWRVEVQGKKKRLQVQGPHGGIFDFQMRNGTWLRRVAPPEKGPVQKPKSPPLRGWVNPTETQIEIGLTQRKPKNTTCA